MGQDDRENATSADTTVPPAAPRMAWIAPLACMTESPVSHTGPNSYSGTDGAGTSSRS